MAGTDTARTAAVATFAALNVLYSLSLRPGGRRIWWATLASVVAVLVGVESGLLDPRNGVGTPARTRARAVALARARAEHP